MAINQNSVAFLFYCKQNGVDFERTLMLGRQELYCPKNKIKEMADVVGYKHSLPENIEVSGKYCESLFSLLGASISDSMDISDFEHATILHDLNMPVPEKLKEKYSVIVDVGTLEHVFNFPVAIKNCMELLSGNGHFIGITPVNNHLGHGFYQFSPELFYTVFSSTNGFSVIKILLVADNEDGSIRDWYEVTDPAIAGERVSLSGSSQLSMMVVAKKINSKPIFVQWPQQSDYVSAWATANSLNNGKKQEDVSTIKFLYRKWTPLYIKNFIGNVLNLFRKRNVVNEDLGMIDPRFFKKINFGKVQNEVQHK